MTTLLLAALFASPPDDAAAALALARAARTRTADAPIQVVHDDSVPAPMPPAVCRVDVPGRSAGGSGTVVACEGGLSLVVTNRHVVPDRNAGGVVVTLGGRRYPVKYHAAHPDPAVDLALLTVEGELPAAEVGDAEPAAGAELRQWGYEYRGGGKPVPKSGRAVSHDPVNLHSTVPCESGDSGCGVFDDRGRLVGVNHGYVGFPGRRGDALAVRLSVVRAFLRDRAGAVFPRLAGKLGGPATPAGAAAAKPRPSPGLIVGVSNGEFGYVLTPPGVEPRGAVIDYGGGAPRAYPLGTMAAPQTGRTPAELFLRRQPVAGGVFCPPGQP